MKKILAIETSCDETALSLVSYDRYLNGHLSQFKILDEQIYSQIDLHKLYGGVVPELASREHIKALSIILNLFKAKNLLSSLDAIAVTAGPGLKGCLLVGVNFAKGLSLALNTQLLFCNHVEGHIFSCFLAEKFPQYPFLSLVVSGGHTELILVNGFRNYEILASTIDDAGGEAFDKSANLLGFDYPGGAKLASLADSFIESKQTTEDLAKYKLPQVMKNSKNFSFSGLKTAISLLIQNNKNTLIKDKPLVCYQIQKSIVDAILSKVENTLKDFKGSQLCLGGGVAANNYLRQRLKEVTNAFKVELLTPDIKHCTDNATMIGYTAGMQLEINGKNMQLINPRWSLSEL